MVTGCSAKERLNACGVLSPEPPVAGRPAVGGSTAGSSEGGPGASCTGMYVLATPSCNTGEQGASPCRLVCGTSRAGPTDCASRGLLVSERPRRREALRGRWRTGSKPPLWASVSEGKGATGLHGAGSKAKPLRDCCGTRLGRGVFNARPRRTIAHPLSLKWPRVALTHGADGARRLANRYCAV